MAETAAEQALFRLSPIVHSLRYFNQYLARAMLRNSMIDWLVWTGAPIFVAVLLGSRGIFLLLQVATSSMVLPFIGTIFLDYSSNNSMQSRVVLRWIFSGIAVTWLTFLGLAAVLCNGPEYKVPNVAIAAWLMSIGFILANLAIAIAIIVVRWRVMMAAPIAFPAGRMTV